MGVTPAQVRELVARLPGTQEGAHHGHPDFRVKKKIFATLSEAEDRAALRLTHLEARALAAGRPTAGAWSPTVNPSAGSASNWRPSPQTSWPTSWKRPGNSAPQLTRRCAGRMIHLGSRAHQILAGLDDRFRLLGDQGVRAPERQRTLRAAVEWSHDLLSADEKVLFRRLSAFAGGRSLEAAEAVCSGNGLHADRNSPCGPPSTGCLPDLLR